MATEFLDDDHVTWTVEWKNAKEDPHGWLVFRSTRGERTAHCEQHVGVEVMTGSRDPRLMEKLDYYFKRSS